uniref:kinesin-4 isoform X3 n=1 Tax=Fragaria vesca subsp. vesca TaxID=101020 RepID=UPI0005C8E4BD|nr:PREDICTED: kinesin-4 isoform X3 [Fragaria vesca subsp. vesca]
MESSSDYRKTENGGTSSSNVPANGDISGRVVFGTGEIEGKRLAYLVEWLNSLLPDLDLPATASDEDLRSFLIDGTILCRILNRLRPCSVEEVNRSDQNSVPSTENVARFLAAADSLGLPRFNMVDLEKGSMKTVIDCLLTLRTRLGSVSADGFSLFSPTSNYDSPRRDISSRGFGSPLSIEERQKVLSESKFQRALRSPVMSEPSTGLMHHVGHKFHEVFQFKQGRYADLPAAKISEMMKSNSLDYLLLQNAPTQSLLSVVNGILDESVERNNSEIPHRVACLLRKVVQEIERRISTQAEHLRTQNNVFKAREEKYQSRIRVLEALASGTNEESELFRSHLQQIKNERTKIEEKKKTGDEDVIRLKKEKEHCNLEISGLKQELDIAKKTFDLRYLQMETDAKGVKAALEEKVKELERNLADSRNKVKELEENSESKHQVSNETLKLEFYKENLKLEEKVKELERLLEASRNKMKELEESSESKYQFSQGKLEERVKELENLLADSRKKEKELEANSESKCQSWIKKERVYHRFMEVQLGSLKELRLSSVSIKQEIMKAEQSSTSEFDHLGVKLQSLADAAENYHSILAENRKLFNEIQDLKGNIRVYCRIRPFLPGQKDKRTLVEQIGDNGELVVADHSKPGKDGHRLFKFNKVYGSDATQAQVYTDTQPFIRSVLDGYNVCIFAYGQTGSGKTYTMTGPNKATKENWGVNYRALNDLFDISQKRKSSILYEIGVQMIEIYNEQVRDLLSSDGTPKKLGIMTHSQPNGLAVPDATMRPVNSTSDVMRLMDIGFKNRAVSATALNERSSRSHSVLTVHVRGTDLKTSTALVGNLHLVDLAGSERVDRSEVTGDRLKEAQHINKSLSALGDVIFSLAQKSPHVPYRNSKLTQVLQSSLGGQAKTLMFVQLNPETNSFSESISTLKFAERVAGVELGAAKTNKEGRDARELMEQVAILKDTISKKDNEIERLHLLKEIQVEKHGTRSLSSDTDSQQSMNDLKHQNNILRQSKVAGDEIETDGSASADSLSFSDSTKSESLEQPRRAARIPRPSSKPAVPSTPTMSALKSPSTVSSGLKKSSSSSSLKPASKRLWH